jgi:hypothetical protein
MKPTNIVKIIIGALLLIIIVILFLGNRKIDKLQADFNSSQGKNIVYEIQAQQLKDSIAKLNTSYVFLQKHNDSLIKIYNNKVSERDAIIAKYKKEHQHISSLTRLESIKYFNAKLNSASPIIITSVIPDTAFQIPVLDIMKANHVFLQRDEVLAENVNLHQSESSLLRINDNLKLEINNRQSTVDKLTELVNNKDNQISEDKKQIKDLEKINKKQHRADNIGKILIGTVAVAVGIVVGLIL